MVEFIVFWCPREESNLNYKLRKLASYPLNDEGKRVMFDIVRCFAHAGKGCESSKSDEPGKRFYHRFFLLRFFEIFDEKLADLVWIRIRKGNFDIGHKRPV